MIGLINHAMKMVSTILLFYLLRETTDFFPESQSGFRSGRSTRNAIYILARLIDHCLTTDTGPEVESQDTGELVTVSGGDDHMAEINSENDHSGNLTLDDDRSGKLTLDDKPAVEKATWEQEKSASRQESSHTDDASPQIILESPTDTEAPLADSGSVERSGGAPRAVVTYIDLVAAFDSISHKFLDQALEEAQCSAKTRAIFRAIYSTATAVVRVTPPGGGDRVHCEPFPVHRGCIQGDNFSPVCFIVALRCAKQIRATGCVC